MIKQNSRPHKTPYSWDHNGLGSLNTCGINIFIERKGQLSCRRHQNKHQPNTSCYCPSFFYIQPLLLLLLLLLVLNKSMFHCGNDIFQYILFLTLTQFSEKYPHANHSGGIQTHKLCIARAHVLPLDHRASPRAELNLYKSIFYRQYWHQNSSPTFDLPVT